MDKLSPELRRWVSSEKRKEPRTVIIRIEYSKNQDAAAAELCKEGIQVESVGPGTITAIANGEKLEDLTQLQWIMSINEPKKLYPKLKKRDP